MCIRDRYFLHSAEIRARRVELFYIPRQLVLPLHAGGQNFPLCHHQHGARFYERGLFVIVEINGASAFQLLFVHDFESTSKKNIKEQTPEMAEREQEILMWMGDIRDDFILEAEDYKHYQSDKSVPGYFIVGGTLAAAAAICTAIFFQTGRNRIDHSNVPMQLPYQTEETKEIEWETEEETTEEETTQAETTEAETTEAASQETTNEDGSLSAAASEPFANNLPIAEDEYLVLTTGEGSYNWLGGDMVLALDSSGEEVLRLPGYGITGNSEYISNGMVVNENTPLVLYTRYEDGASDISDYASAQMGIYSLKDRKWIVEPARQSVTLFSDSVYMIGSDVGNLYRTDGTCIEEGAEDAVSYTHLTLPTKLEV